MPASRRLLSLIAALGLAAPALAQTTYHLAVTGEIDHEVNCWETVPLCSGPPQVQYAWTGTLTVVVDSAADGTYTGPGFESLSFAGNLGSFTAVPDDADPFYSVTITGGQVSSLDVRQFLDTAHDTTAWDDYSGLVASYYGSGGTHYGGTMGVGTLSPIPEPAPAALLLTGAFACAALRRRQACASGQRGFTSNA